MPSLIDTGRDGHESVELFRDRAIMALDGHSILKPRDLDPYKETLPMVQFLQGHVRGYLLEIGCGFGRLSRLLVPPAVHYVGIDPVEERVIEASRLYGCGHARFAHMESYDVQASGNGLYRQFDTAISVTVLQHLTMPQAVSLLRIAYTAVQPFGRLLMWEAEIFHRDREWCEESYLNDCPRHMIPKPIDELKAAVPFNWTELDPPMHGEVDKAARYVLEATGWVDENFKRMR